MAKSRGVRGAAGACAAASLVYLLGRSLLALLVSALMGLAHPGASLAKPLGFSDVSAALFQLLVGIGAIALTLAFLLKLTRLRQEDLRIALPAPWSPGFCLPVFLGVANLANLAGALINHITDNPTTSELLPSGGPELLVCFITLCIMPAVAEELLFRGAFQGLMRPCGSAALRSAASRSGAGADGLCLRGLSGLADRAVGQHPARYAAAPCKQYAGIFDDLPAVLRPGGAVLRR